MSEHREEKVKREEFVAASRYFLQLVRSELEGKTAEEKPTDVRWENVYALSRIHYMSGIVYRAVKRLQNQPQADLLEQWERSYLMNVYVDVEQSAAWEEIKELVAESGITVLPLKGLRLKSLYPESFMRVMSDLDIFCDEKDFPAFKKKLIAAGYDYHPKSAAHYHKVFLRGNVYLEIHTSLLPVTSPFREYYRNVWDKTQPSEEKNVRVFTREHEYLFLLIHALKHFSEQGSGARTIVDFALFSEKYAGELDRTIVDREIAAADAVGASADGEESLAEFESTVKEQIGLWFGQETVRTDDASLKILSDGVYGKKENQIEKSVAKGGKKKYILARLFPKLSFMRTEFPVLAKFPFLYPFCWLWRLIRVVLFRRKKLKDELRIMNECKKEPTKSGKETK